MQRRLLSASMIMLAGLLVASSSASAATITYTSTGTISGSIGATPFVNESAIFTFVTTNTNIASNGASHISNGGTGTFAIPNLGILANATGIWSVFSNTGSGGYGGFFNSTANDYLFVTGNAALGSYDLSTDFGPVSGPGYLGSVGTSTDLGVLNVTSVTGQTTFSAALGDGGGGGDAPEPATFALVGLGLLVAGAYRRRTRR